MNVEEVLTRADVHVSTIVHNGNVTTLFESKSAKPLTMEEAKTIIMMKRAAGEKQNIMFSPVPQ